MNKLIINPNDQAVKELCNADSQMKKLVSIIGDIEVALRPNYFQSLVRSMIGQQISVHAASAIYQRLKTLLNNKITANAFDSVSDEQLKSVGLSARKIIYLRDLSAKVATSELNFNTFHQLNNSQIIKILTSIKGIGKWTAEMFLIFSLGRMDVLALDDIGIQRGAKWLYEVDKSERRKILLEKSKLWKPHFTIASFYLWETVHLNFVNKYDSIDDILKPNSS